jgi:5-methylcytosine-specific restriction endonuclease McrA
MTARAEFDRKTKRDAFLRAGGKCERCTAKLFPGNVEFDHALPCALGGDNSLANCVCLCRTCHRTLKTPEDIRRIRKADRQQSRNLGIRKAKGRPMPGSRASGLRKRMDGTVERRDA